MLLRDIATRRYPVHLQSYDGLLEDPTGVLRKVLAWLGVGDLEAALDAIKPERRTQRDSEVGPQELAPEVIEVFDRLYATVHEGRPVDAALLQALNETHGTLAPRIAEHQRAITRERRRQRARRGEGEGEGEGEDDEQEQPTW